MKDKESGTAIFGYLYLHGVIGGFVQGVRVRM
jgi:hypothetical protein